MMTLSEILLMEELAEDGAGAIYIASSVDQATPETEAIVRDSKLFRSKATSDGRLWTHFLELEYLDNARRQCSFVRDGKCPSQEELVDALMWYARHDS